MPMPRERRERNPLLTPAGWENLRRIAEHPAAPRWNYAVGDRIGEGDLERIAAFRRNAATAPAGRVPPDALLARVDSWRATVPAVAENLSGITDLAGHWPLIPTTNRSDLALRLDDFVPDDADLERLIVYDTSGATGHAFAVPTHPATIAQTQVLLETALRWHGVEPEFSPDTVAAVCLGGQARTVTFPTVFSIWNQAGFAKINLHPEDWEDRDRPQRFLEDLAPQFITGDPVGYAEMLRWGIHAAPQALVSTAVALAPALRRRLAAACGCPILDWYSTTETGPVACTCPAGEGMHLVAPDLFVEVLGEDGQAVPEGQTGEITVTGGRNPYLALLRYRTGDRAALRAAPCPCGLAAPRLIGLAGREPVTFRDSAGGPVSPVDIGRTLREAPILLHALTQQEDGTLDLAVRFLPGAPDLSARLASGLQELFGQNVPVRVTVDERLGDAGKVEAYRCLRQ